MQHKNVAPVTVVIPCFRCAGTIRRAVDSIVQQTHKPAEVIFVDDASGDETLGVLRTIEKQYSGWIKVITLTENSGAASARNVGWAAATQPYIAFLDSDDAWHPQKIEIQYAYMSAHPQVALCGHGYRRLTQENALPDWPVVDCVAQPIHKWLLLLSNRFVTPSVMLRRDIEQRFVEKQRYMEDHMLWLKIVCNGGRVVKLSAELAAIYKRPFGVMGLSAQFWSMERGDLGNYRRLYRANCINGFQLGVLAVYSVLKYVRRLVIYWTMLRREIGRVHATEIAVAEMKNDEVKHDNASSVSAVSNSIADEDSAVLQVVIVMATYNGVRFIEEQIRSIQEQTDNQWVLYIRDDGSSDDTVQKIMQMEREDHRVKLLRDDPGNRGPIGNFAALMKVALEANADHVFFADQDDVWHREKLATMLASLRENELTYGAQTPLLVHCDLEVVDEALQPIANSFVKLSMLSPTTADLGVLLCQNQVTGCACVINRALLVLACPLPSNVLMHDWWLALLASSVGKIEFIPDRLVKYRQHEGNVLGASSLSLRINKLLFSQRQREKHSFIIKRSFIQAQLLEERIKTRGISYPPKVMRQINTYAKVLNVPVVLRANKLRQQKIGKNSICARWLFNMIITFAKK